MKILITDSYIALGDLKTNEISLVKSRFTYKDSSKAMTKRGFDKRKVKSVCFAAQKKGALILRTGFLKELFVLLKENRMQISEVKDKRTKYKKKEYSYEQLRKLFNPDFKYVEHQINSLKALLKTNVGIIKAPTSAGKTEIIIALMTLTKHPTLILVDSVSLAEQNMKRINDAGLDCGICSGQGVLYGKHMISTIGSYKKLTLSQFERVIVDECHIAGANTFQEFFETTNYPMRYGFSATPDGNDKYRYAKIRQYIGDVIFEIFTDELMDNEVMARPKIKMVNVDCMPTPSWDSAYEKCITNNERRNKKIAALAKDNIEEKKPTLILYKIIEHGKKLGEMIPDAVVLCGSDSQAVRKKAVDGFIDGTVLCLIASNIFKQGISINNVQTLINASGGKSKIEVLQKIGRSLRLHKDKDYALVYDFIDAGNRFTEKHSLQREHLYKKNGFIDIEVIDYDA